MASPLRGILRRPTPPREAEEEGPMAALREGIAQPSLREELREAYRREGRAWEESDFQVQELPGSPSGNTPPQQAGGSVPRPRAGADTEGAAAAAAAAVWDEDQGQLSTPLRGHQLRSDIGVLGTESLTGVSPMSSLTGEEVEEDGDDGGYGDDKEELAPSPAPYKDEAYLYKENEGAEDETSTSSVISE